ncbi:MAG: FIST C-terminal domain-containing protein [Chloroflexi bacterium]|nr:FIST C-terminal domain-containing protein [Chloroflexota bacterium]
MNETVLFASATAQGRDISETTRALAESILNQIGHLPVNLLIAFLSPHFARGSVFVADNLRDALHPRVMLGCTAEGVIGRDAEIEREPAITVVAAHLPAVELVPFALNPEDWDATLKTRVPFEQTLGAPRDTRLFVLLADPFSTPMDRVLDAFNRFYPGVPMVGGMASGSARAKGNSLLLNERVFIEGAVGVALRGAFEVDVVVSQGCRPIGRAFTVSNARENVIYAIEGEPPLPQIQSLIEQLAPSDRALLNNGLYVGRAIDPTKPDLGRGDFLVRGLVGVDHESGAIAIGDHVRAGETIQFHLRDATTATEDLEMQLTPQTFFDQPSGALVFSCNGRGTRLYPHPNGDIQTIQSVLGGVNLAGFFCAGEIGPIGGKNFLHGQTASIALFRPANPTS